MSASSVDVQTATASPSPATIHHGPCHTVYQVEGTPWLEPVQISAPTVMRLATASGTLTSVLEVMGNLTPDDYLDYLKGYYRQGQARFGEHWYYSDLLTVLHAACQIAKPRNYLEIGVRRGRSLGVVSSVVPDCEIHGFDMWVAEYAGMPNPGPDFVEQELRRIGHRGGLHLVSGDSHQTVPAFFADNPEVRFDLINVDGDHSEAGAKADLETVLPRLSVGGVLVLDDITHPQHRYLESIWDEVIERDSRFTSAKYRDLGYGVAVAIRQRD